MESHNSPPTDNTPAEQDRVQIASTYQTSPAPKTASADKKQTKAQPATGDLTSRLVSLFLWLSFGTTVGCISQMAVTRRPPNVGAGMAVGLAAALTCAYKDLESAQGSQQLLAHPQKFFNRFEVRLDKHSVQLAENTAGQERLEHKLDLLAGRVDTLTLAMVRPTGLTEKPASPAPPPAGFATDASTNGNGQPKDRLGAGF